MRQLFILLVPLAVACAPTHWAATFESHFENVMDLCLEDKHPEAGAKAAGLDVATYRKQVRAKLAEAERVFDNPEGESYLPFEFADQVEDDKAACVAEILQRVRASES